ncbi:MAG TPA: hypothetical protein VFI54_11830 [Solirubrobacteraceae bacterium]|nr:hypothetical protein [Solirubrobacteraceae bacterium]
MAVGSYGGNTSRALTERWNGSRWSLVPARLPAGAIHGGFNDVSCTSARNCIAVGAYDINPRQSHVLVERWNGSRWSIQTALNQAGEPVSLLSSVSCASARACTAVGEYGSPGNSPPFVLAEHWNGSRWSLQPAVSAGEPEGFLAGVSCTAPSACTAVGGGARGHARVERWNGASWTLQHTPSVPKADLTLFSAVSCTSAIACTAVGTDSTGRALFPLAQGWNGRRWSSQGAHFAGDDFTSVSCTAPRACTAVGDASGGAQTLTAAWDGSRWSVQPSPQATDQRANHTLFDVSCTSRSICFAVGGINRSSNGTAVGPLIERRS